MANVDFIRGQLSKIDERPVNDGNILLATNTGQLFIDVGGSRISISSVVVVDTLPESTQAKQDILYYAKDTNYLHHYNGNNFDIVNVPPTGSNTPSQVIVDLGTQTSGQEFTITSEQSEQLLADVAPVVHATVNGYKIELYRFDKVDNSAYYTNVLYYENKKYFMSLVVQGTKATIKSLDEPTMPVPRQEDAGKVPVANTNDGFDLKQLTASDIDGVITVTDEEISESPIVNADTLGGKPTSDYVTKDDIVLNQDNVVICDISLITAESSHQINSKLYFILEDNILHTVYDQTYTFGASGESAEEIHQIIINLPSSGSGSDLKWVQVGSSSDSIFIYELINAGSQGVLPKINRVPFNGFTPTDKSLNIYVHESLRQASTLSITIPRGFYYGAQKV